MRRKIPKKESDQREVKFRHVRMLATVRTLLLATVRTLLLATVRTLLLATVRTLLLYCTHHRR